MFKGKEKNSGRVFLMYFVSETLDDFKKGVSELESCYISMSTKMKNHTQNVQL